MTLCFDADELQYHTTFAEKPLMLVIRNATLLHPSVLEKLSANQDTRNVRFEFLTAGTTTTEVFCDMTLCRRVYNS
jgi:hypothetical protein